MSQKKIGIIGYGSMGSMLLHGFLESDIISSSSLFVSTRTKEKLPLLNDMGINICLTNKELTDKCDIIFICVKPLEVKGILEEIKNNTGLSKHIISIAGGLTISHIEKIIKGKISRVIPTLLSEIKTGITLVNHNSNVSADDIELLDKLLGIISEVKVVPENELELISVLTSCAPGLIAAIFKEYVNSAEQYTSLSKEEINDIVIKTLYGASKLFTDKNFSFNTIIKRVATPGGTTERGIQVLESGLPDLFSEMFSKAIERQSLRKQKIDEQFDIT